MFDSTNKVVEVRIRNQETLAMAYFCMAADALNQTQTSKFIYSERVRLINSLEHGPQTPLHYSWLLVAHASLGNIEQAIRYLPGIGPQGPKMFMLLGITQDQAKFNGIGERMEFKEYCAKQLQVIEKNKKKVLELLPSLLNDSPRDEHAEPNIRASNVISITRNDRK